MIITVCSISSCSDDDDIVETPIQNSSISIVSSEFPIVGDVIERMIDTVPTYDIGLSGENVIWDFTELANGIPITNELLDPANTPYATAYSEANIALAGGGGFFDNMEIWFLGVYSKKRNSSTPFQFSTPFFTKSRTSINIYCHSNQSQWDILCRLMGLRHVICNRFVLIYFFDSV